MASEQRAKMSGTLSALGGAEACGARWTLGALLLAPLAAANSSYCAVLAVMLLAVFVTVASKYRRYLSPTPTFDQARFIFEKRQKGLFYAKYNQLLGLI